MPNDNCLFYQIGLPENSLNGLGSNVFAQAELHQIFLSIGNPNESVRVDLTDVTCLKPAILIDYFASLSRLIEIPDHYLAAARTDFSVVCDFQFRARKRLAYGTDL